MSKPENPLNNFNSTSIKHILVAFKYTEDAEAAQLNPSMGNPGTTFIGKGCKGPGVVIVNEFTDSDFNIYSASWKFNSFGPITQTAPSCLGMIEITDRTGLHFVDFMKTKVIPTLDVSEGHMVFSLRTFFIGESINVGSNDVIVGNPFIFNVVTFLNDLSPDSGRFYTMGIVGSSTTLGQLNQYSKLYQMTITHSDGNLHKEIPIPDVATCGMKSRKEEDALQRKARKNRIDKSKPMRSLKEVFAAFEAELNQQKFPNSAQLQSWLQKINANYSVKIIPPTQKKKGEIPVDYFIHLDSAYHEYEIDNRNLPFEQPEQDQNKKGIRSIPVQVGMDIPTMIEKLMKLSQQVGLDAEFATPYVFKTVISAIKSTNGRYQIHVVIKKIRVPKNSSVVNSGPGESAVTVPLEFVFQDPEYKDKDIVSITAKVISEIGLRVLEEQTNDASGLMVYGDREQITAERLPNVDYFKAQYSGLRSMVNPKENYGLESGVNAAKIDNVINADLIQGTSYTISIQGNPHLLSDLNRPPSQVANGIVGNPQLYKLPELDPMYVKLSIFLKPHAALGVQENENVSNKFYYNSYYHVASVTNKFEQGSFMQDLVLLRTDETL